MSRSRKFATALTALAGMAFLVAGPIMIFKGFEGRQQITNELVAQKIVFPQSVAKGLPEDLRGWAGKSVRDGSSARAYADMVEEHVLAATGGKSFSEVSAAWIATGRTDATLGQTRQTAFMGESLRGSLMSAYQAWQVTLLVIGLGFLVGGLGVVLLSIAAALRPQRVRVPDSPAALTQDVVSNF